MSIFKSTAEEIWKLNGGVTRMEKIICTGCRYAGLTRWADQLTPVGSAHYQQDWKYYPEFEAIQDNTWTHGNYQSEKFFLPVADVLRQHFTFRYPATPRVIKMGEKIRQQPSVAVHFRRGDYVTNKNFAQGIGVLDLDYYQNALTLLKKQLPQDTVYYIFSDDIDAIRREFCPEVSHEFVDVFDHANYYDKIRLMAMCEHNIIANSTFSWWAAWLNTNPDKTIIAPEQWYADDHHPSDDLIPTSWKRL